MLKFGALWCAPCRAFEKTWQKVKAEFPAVAMVSVDVDDQQELAQAYGVRAVPAVAVEVDDRAVLHTGAMPEQKLRDLLRSVGASPAIEPGNPQSRIG